MNWIIEFLKLRTKLELINLEPEPDSNSGSAVSNYYINSNLIQDAKCCTTVDAGYKKIVGNGI